MFLHGTDMSNLADFTEDQRKVAKAMGLPKNPAHWSPKDIENQFKRVEKVEPGVDLIEIDANEACVPYQIAHTVYDRVTKIRGVQESQEEFDEKVWGTQGTERE